MHDSINRILILESVSITFTKIEFFTVNGKWYSYIWLASTMKPTTEMLWVFYILIENHKWCLCKYLVLEKCYRDSSLEYNN